MPKISRNPIAQNLHQIICAGAVPIINSPPRALASSTKLNGSPISPIGQNEIARGSMLAELNALQLRCSALELALAQPSSLHHHDRSNIRPFGPINDIGTLSMKPDDIGSSSGTSFIANGPERLLTGSSGHPDSNCLDNSLEAPFGQTLSTFGVLGSDSCKLDREALLEDHAQLHAFVDNNNDFYFSDFFDFNDASLPLSLDTHDGVTTSFADRFIEAGSDTGEIPTLPNVHNLESLPVAVVLVANPTQTRHRCPNCTATFRRSSDRDRHARSHNPNAPRYACPFPGCARVGRHGFPRKDKLTQHQAHKGH